jgi:MFS family permease
VSHSVAVDSRAMEPPGDLIAWIVCLSAGLFFFYEFFQLNIFDVINQPLREDFHLNATQLSWMSSTYLWADLLFLLPAGLILDRYSTRTVILSAMFLCVLGTVGFALTNSFLIASLCHFLSGIGNAFCFLSCVVLTSHWFPLRKQALVLGFLITLAFLGGMVAHTPFAYLYESLGWRRALLMDGALGAVLLLWLSWVVRDGPEGSVVQKQNSQRSFRTELVSALSNPQNWMAGFYTSFLNLPIMVLCALWGVNYLQAVHHLPEVAASNAVSLIFIGSMIGCPVAGWFADSQKQRKPLMILAAIATLLTLVPLFLPLALSQQTLNILFFTLGFFTSAQVISYPLIVESNPIENIGVSTGIASMIIMGGGGAAQVLFGWLMVSHAKTAEITYTFADFQFAMWMFPIAVIGALMAALLMRETHGTPKS